MNLTEQTCSIIQLVWSRMLKIPDQQLENTPPGSRIETGDDDAGALMLVRLFDRTVLYGPPRLVQAARNVSGAKLTQESALLDLARQQHSAARSLGQAELFYSEPTAHVGDALLHPPSTLVSRQPEHLQVLLDQCPADDAALSGLRDAEWSATLLDEVQVRDSGMLQPHRALAAAGWEVWHHMLGHIGVLTHPQHRRRGLARSIAAVAVQEALAEGLIPQWRAAANSPGSAKVARSLSFESVGSQTTVVFDH